MGKFVCKECGGWSRKYRSKAQFILILTSIGLGFYLGWLLK